MAEMKPDNLRRDIAAARGKLVALRDGSEKVLSRHSFYFKAMATASIVIPAINGVVALSHPIIPSGYVSALNYASGVLGVGFAGLSVLWVQVQASRRGKTLYEALQQLTTELGAIDQDIQNLDLADDEKEFLREAIAVKNKLTVTYSDLEKRLRSTNARPEEPF